MYKIMDVFCPGYLEWWLDSNMNNAFIHYMLKTVSVAYIHMDYLRGGYSSVIPDQNTV